jgi:hypothetical protein
MNEAACDKGFQRTFDPLFDLAKQDLTKKQKISSRHTGQYGKAMGLRSPAQ